LICLQLCKPFSKNLMNENVYWMPPEQNLQDKINFLWSNSSCSSTISWLFLSSTMIRKLQSIIAFYVRICDFQLHNDHTKDYQKIVLVNSVRRQMVQDKLMHSETLLREHHTVPEGLSLDNVIETTRCIQTPWVSKFLLFQCASIL